MATITSAQTGNFTDTATWTGGVVPTTGDVASVAAGHVVTINSTVTCDQVTNANNSGYFDLADGAVLNAAVTGGATAANNSVLRYNGTTSATINGNVTTTNTTSSVRVINLTNTGTLTINGDVTGGGGSNSLAIVGTAAGTKLTIVGNVAAGTRSAISLSGASAVVTITGSVTGGGGLALTTGGASTTVAITGDVSTSGYSVSGGNNTTVTVTGNVTAGVSGGGGITSDGSVSSAVVTVTGNVTAAGAGGIALNGPTSVVDVTGTIASSTNGFGVATPHFNADGRCINSGDLIDGPTGRAAVYAPLRRVRITTETVTQHRTPAENDGEGDPVIRASLDYVTNNVPVPADVREGTVYADDQFTGTLAVPPANAVGAGVPVDDTVGTAALSLEAVAALIAAYDPSES